MMAVLVVSGLRVTALLGYLIIPLRMRPTFAMAGMGALIVWFPAQGQSPRWLEAQGRPGFGDYPHEVAVAAVHASRDRGRICPCGLPARAGVRRRGQGVRESIATRPQPPQ